MSWRVIIQSKLIKALANRRKTPVEIEKIMILLVRDLEVSGPAIKWPNYGKLSQGKAFDRRHCHIRKGKPTWVACWEVDKNTKTIEVYYVGTHEKAPY